jgi:transglutaminase-like putative cysteine protease
MMFRPRDSHHLQLLSTKLAINPKPVHIRWAFDVFGNSIAFAEFGEVKSNSLTFESEISLYHYEALQPTALLLDAATRFPFQYAHNEVADLAPLIVLNRPDPEHRLSAWAKRFVDIGNGVTLDILTLMMRTIHASFQYQRRQAFGTRDPVTTLALQSGTCRDFALLMIEALRTLGIAARFVSGYIYTPKHQHDHGATHAWVQVYLPGCGWIDIDPTNGIFGNRDLITVAVVRDHTLASPLSGNFVGPSSVYNSMKVSVSVSQLNPVRHHASGAR